VGAAVAAGVLPLQDSRLGGRTLCTAGTGVGELSGRPAVGTPPLQLLSAPVWEGDCCAIGIAASCTTGTSRLPTSSLAQASAAGGEGARPASRLPGREEPC
jgi:hypothetical protein